MAHRPAAPVPASPAFTEEPKSVFVLLPCFFWGLSLNKPIVNFTFIASLFSIRLCLYKWFPFNFSFRGRGAYCFVGFFVVLCCLFLKTYPAAKGAEAADGAPGAVAAHGVGEVAGLHQGWRGLEG